MTSIRSIPATPRPGCPAPSLYAAYGPSHSWLSEPVDPGLARATPNSTTASETALDVEWAHAIAPGAKIDLVEVNITAFANLSYYAADAATLAMAAAYAASLPGVGVVSLSYGVCNPSGLQSHEHARNTARSLFHYAHCTPPGHVHRRDGRQRLDLQLLGRPGWPGLPFDIAERPGRRRVDASPQ